MVIIHWKEKKSTCLFSTWFQFFFIINAVGNDLVECKGFDGSYTEFRRTYIHVRFSVSIAGSDGP